MEEIKVKEGRDSKLHTGHRKRMRERFLKSGAESFADHELIEMLLYNTYPRRDTNELAHKLLSEYNDNLVMLMEAEPEDIMFRCGFNESTAIFFSIIRELLRRYSDERFKERKILDTPKLAGEYAVYLLSQEKRECFYVLCLDAQSRLIMPMLVSKGIITESNVYLRNVVEAAIKCNAVSVIFAHNHPSGSLEPSQDDKDMTKKLIRVLNDIDVSVSDHIIVADDKFYSFAAYGNIF